mgnify:CR=1 FL=1
MGGAPEGVSDTRMRVLVIGYGSMGRRHARTAHDLGHDVCVYDTRWTKPTDESADGYAVGLTLSDAVALEPDAVVVATPARTHSDVAEQLILFGYDGPLFVEKPLALSVADAEVFAHWPCTTSMVGYNWRCHPLVHELERKMADHGNPAITRGVFWLECDRATWPGSDYADTLLEGSHEIDLSLAFCGRVVTKVDAASDSAVHVRLAHASGILSYVVLDDHAPGKYERGCRLICEDDYIGGYTSLDPASNEMDRWAIEESYRRELAHFLAAAEAVETTAVPFAHGLDVLRVCDAARYQMAATALG